MATVAQNIATLLRRSARRFPSRPALAIGNRVAVDYATLARRVSAIASSLRRELHEGDRVLLASRNCVEYIEMLFACWHAGLCAVPVNSKLHPAEMDYVVENSGARWAFADRAWCSALESSATGHRLGRVIELGSAAYNGLRDGDGYGDGDGNPAPVLTSAPAWMFYTSGTTGRPKGVVLSHGNLLAASLCFLTDVEPVAVGDTILHAAPLSHGSGLYVIPHIIAGAVNVVPESQGFDPQEILDLLPRWTNVRMFAAPTMVKRLIQHPGIGDARLDRLASIIFGGGPMYVEDCKRAHAMLGPRLAQIYGQGESPMTITALPRLVLDEAIARGDDARLASVGTAQIGIDVRIADVSLCDDRAMPSGEIGEVLVRGATVMQGYWNNPAATAATLAGGWLHTGDLGSVDGDGYLTLKDRSKDLIISGGANIYPREVEEVLLTHSEVMEVSVIGRPHPEWGEEVVACVVARDPLPGMTHSSLEHALDRLCLSRIARFKRPRAYIFIGELPKNNAGKVLKTMLREIVGDGLPSVWSPALPSDGRSTDGNR